MFDTKQLRDAFSNNSFEVCNWENRTSEQDVFCNDLNMVVRHKEVATKDDICSIVNSKKQWLELFIILCAVLCFIVLGFCYGRIFKLVLIQRKNRSIKKLIVTTCLLLGVFAISWLPLAIFETVMWAIVTQTKQPHASDLLFFINGLFMTLYMLHSLLNPIIYVGRLPNIQRSVVLHFSRFLPFLRKYNQSHRPSFANIQQENKARTSVTQTGGGIDAFEQAIVNYGNPQVPNNSMAEDESTVMLQNIQQQQPPYRHSLETAEPGSQLLNVANKTDKRCVSWNCVVDCKFEDGPQKDVSLNDGKNDDSSTAL